MADQYHYDSKGNYTGKTSDTPPHDGGGCGCLILIILAFIVFSGTNPNGKSTNKALPDKPVEALSKPNLQPETDLTPAVDPVLEPEVVIHEEPNLPEQNSTSKEDKAASSDSSLVSPKEE